MLAAGMPEPATVTPPPPILAPTYEGSACAREGPKEEGPLRMVVEAPLLLF